MSKKMNKKLGIRIVVNSNTDLESWDRALCYGDDQLTRPFGKDSCRFNWCASFVTDFTAIQSELEALRAKSKAFDWLERNYNDLGLEILHVRDNVWTLSSEGAEIVAYGSSLLLAIEDFISRHKPENPVEGDTMETIPPSEIRNVLEIRDIAENYVALFFDGVQCSDSYHSSGCLGEICTKLADYVASLESRAAEAQSLLEEKDGIEKDLKVVSGSLLKAEHRIAELEPLAEAAEDIENQGLAISLQDGTGQWMIWNRLESHGQGELTGFGKTVFAALADYRDKHPEPEEDEVITLLKELVDENMSDGLVYGRSSELTLKLNKARTYLAREGKQ